MLARLTFRPQAPKREMARILERPRQESANRALPLPGLPHLAWIPQAWADDIGPAAIALTKMDFFERGGFAAIVFHALRQIVTGQAGGRFSTACIGPRCRCWRGQWIRRSPFTPA